MTLIDTVPTTKVTVPNFLRGKTNGKLDLAWLRSPDRPTTVDPRFMLFEPVSYAMQAMQVAAERDGVKIPVGNDNVLDTTGRYRTYLQQVQLFNGEKYANGRYKRSPNCNCGSKRWDSDGNGVQETWYLQRNASGNCFAMAAAPDDGVNPGSNHGLGLADDIAEDPDQDNSTPVLSLDDDSLIWLRDHAQAYGFGLETRKERWHWHWIGGNALTQLVVDTLYSIGVLVPDLTRYGFFVPDPTASPDPKPPPQEEDDMVYLAYTDTRSIGGMKQLWRGNKIECYSLGDPDGKGTDAYALVRRNFGAPNMKGVYHDPMDGTVIESADQIPTITPNQVRLDVGTPRSPG